MEAYCVKRRSMREMSNPQAITMKNGRPATPGVCPACSTKMFRPSLHRVPERRVRAATTVSGSAIDTLAANGVKRIYSVRKNLGVKLLDLPPAFTMALLCTAVTLLTCLQADATTGGRHQPNRELLAQGVGNIAAGMIGGNPGGASSTTFLNLQAGGRSKVAGVTSAVVVALAFAVPFNQIPLSMLAGIIIVTGYRVIDWEFLRRVRSIPLGYTVVMLATATVAVLIGFTMAILAGLALSTLVDVTRSYRRELERLVSVPLPDTAIWPDSDPYESRVGLIVMPDRVSVASARELSRILGGDIRASQATIMDFGRTAYIDDTAAALIGKVINRKSVVVSGLHGEPAIMLAAFGTLQLDSCTQDMERAKAVVQVMFETESA